MGYRDHKVVAVTPAGRRRYLEVLLPYMLSNKGVLDEWRLWVNTTDQDDIKWMEATAKDHPKFIKLEYPTEPVNEDFQAYSIFQFFKNCTKKNTVYVRFDDDIVYVHPTAIPALCNARLGNREPFLVCANIVNNAICTHIHQRMGVVTREKGIVTHHCLDSLGWASGEFAKTVHEIFFDYHEKKEVYKYSFPYWHLDPIQRFSINCFAFMGEDFQAFDGKVEAEEEEWLTVTRPTETKRPVMIAGNALVSHFAYFTQRPFLDRSDVLEKYRKIAGI
jgi:hypothetical protein